MDGSNNRRSSIQHILSPIPEKDEDVPDSPDISFRRKVNRGVSMRLFGNEKGTGKTLGHRNMLYDNATVNMSPREVQTDNFYDTQLRTEIDADNMNSQISTPESGYTNQSQQFDQSKNDDDNMASLHSNTNRNIVTVNKTNRPKSASRSRKLSSHQMTPLVLNENQGDQSHCFLQNEPQQGGDHMMEGQMNFSTTIDNEINNNNNGYNSSSNVREEHTDRYLVAPKSVVKTTKLTYGRPGRSVIVPASQDSKNIPNNNRHQNHDGDNHHYHHHHHHQQQQQQQPPRHKKEKRIKESGYVELIQEKSYKNHFMLLQHNRTAEPYLLIDVADNKTVKQQSQDIYTTEKCLENEDFLLQSKFVHKAIIIKVHNVNVAYSGASYIIHAAAAFENKISIGRDISLNTIGIPTDKKLSAFENTFIDADNQGNFSVKSGNSYDINTQSNTASEYFTALRVRTKDYVGEKKRVWWLDKDVIFSVGSSSIKCIELQSKRFSNNKSLIDRTMGSADTLVLEFIEGPLKESRIYIRAQDYPHGVIIGRSSKNSIAVPDRELSRQHTRIDYDITTNRYYLTDLDSLNGTFVQLSGPYNGSHRIGQGDQIMVGRTVLLVDSYDAKNDFGNDSTAHISLDDSVLGEFGPLPHSAKVSTTVTQDDNDEARCVDEKEKNNRDETMAPYVDLEKGKGTHSSCDLEVRLIENNDNKKVQSYDESIPLEKNNILICTATVEHNVFLTKKNDNGSSKSLDNIVKTTSNSKSVDSLESVHCKDIESSKSIISSTPPVCQHCIDIASMLKHFLLHVEDPNDPRRFFAHGDKVEEMFGVVKESQQLRTSVDHPNVEGEGDPSAKSLLQNFQRRSFSNLRRPKSAYPTTDARRIQSSRISDLMSSTIPSVSTSTAFTTPRRPASAYRLSGSQEKSTSIMNQSAYSTPRRPASANVSGRSQEKWTRTSSPKRCPRSAHFRSPLNAITRSSVAKYLHVHHKIVNRYPIEVRSLKNARGGVSVVAVSSIRAGERVLLEEPYLKYVHRFKLGSNSTEQSDDDDSREQHVCGECFKTMDVRQEGIVNSNTEEGLFCTSCMVWYCSADCRDASHGRSSYQTVLCGTSFQDIDDLVTNQVSTSNSNKTLMCTILRLIAKAYSDGYEDISYDKVSQLESERVYVGKGQNIIQDIVAAKLQPNPLFLPEIQFLHRVANVQSQVVPTVSSNTNSTFDLSFWTVSSTGKMEKISLEEFSLSQENIDYLTKVQMLFYGNSLIDMKMLFELYRLLSSQLMILDCYSTATSSEFLSTFHVPIHNCVSHLSTAESLLSPPLSNAALETEAILKTKITDFTTASWIYTGLVVSGACFEHSCNPNVTYGTGDAGVDGPGPERGRGLEFLACRDIEEDEILTINYVPHGISRRTDILKDLFASNLCQQSCCNAK